MEKIAVYTGTRNIYEDMLISAKSLIANSDVDRVIFLTEDDKFPYKLHEKCEVRNVRFQKYFRNDGPNSKSPFSYMAMMRAALGFELPEHDYVVSFDCDTIVVKPIGSYLWELPLGDKYFFAASREPHRCNDKHPLYCNVGVTAHNLKLMRSQNKTIQYIDTLNSRYYRYVDQDVMNYLSYPGILDLDGDYNANDWTVHSDDPKIIHYAGIKRDIWIHENVVKKWRSTSWEEIGK